MGRRFLTILLLAAWQCAEASQVCSCTFESESWTDPPCCFQQTGKYNWTRISDTTILNSTYNVGAKSGTQYMYSYNADASNGDEFVLIANEYLDSNKSCLSFYFNLWDTHPGTLQVKLNDYIADTADSNTNGWRFARFELDGPISVTIRITGYMGSEHPTNIALDDFKIHPVICNYVLTEPRYLGVQNYVVNGYDITFIRPAYGYDDLSAYIIEIYNGSKCELEVVLQCHDYITQNHRSRCAFHRTACFSVGEIFLIYQMRGIYTYSRHTVKVFAVNSHFTSSDARTITEKFESRPTQMTVGHETNRSFDIEFRKPVDRTDLSGFHILLYNSSVCDKEILLKYNADWQVNETKCGERKEEASFYQTEDSVLYTANNLLPAVVYNIQLSAMYKQGPGPNVEFQGKTNEEAPSTPIILTPVAQSSTSVLVRWNISNPYPGQTTFQIRIFDNSLNTRNKTVLGFYTRETLIESLDEYWSYSFVVEASTSVGSSVSPKSSEVRTLQGVPGRVVNLTIVNETYSSSIGYIWLSWDLPVIKEHNGILLESRISVNSSKGNSKTTHPVKTQLNRYIKRIPVHVDVEFEIRVHLINTEGMEGPDEMLTHTVKGIYSAVDGKTITVPVAICGIVLGIALVVGGFITFRIYKRRRVPDAEKERPYSVPRTYLQSINTSEKTYDTIAAQTQPTSIALDEFAVVSLEKYQSGEMEEEFHMMRTCRDEDSTISYNDYETVEKPGVLPGVSNKIDKQTRNTDCPENEQAIIIATLPSETTYIVRRTPTRKALKDFWSQIWQEDVHKIIMFEKEREDTNTDYWRFRNKETVKYEQIRVSCSSEAQLNKVNVITITLQKENVKKLVKHYTYSRVMTKYDHKAADFLLDFMSLVKGDANQNVDQQPVVVHSRTGNGETGIFIAAQTLTHLIATGKDRIDVRDIIGRMLAIKPGIIESQDQYCFIHTLVEFYLYRNPKAKDKERRRRDVPDLPE